MVRIFKSIKGGETGLEKLMGGELLGVTEKIIKNCEKSLAHDNPQVVVGHILKAIEFLCILNS